MQAGVWFYILSGVWAALILVIFIQAIRLSYRIVNGGAKSGHTAA